MAVLMVPVFPMKKLRHREVKPVSRQPTARKSQRGVGLCPSNSVSLHPLFPWDESPEGWCSWRQCSLHSGALMAASGRRVERERDRNFGSFHSHFSSAHLLLTPVPPSSPNLAPGGQARRGGRMETHLQDLLFMGTKRSSSFFPKSAQIS